VGFTYLCRTRVSGKPLLAVALAAV
jgi:hypothetical protein